MMRTMMLAGAGVGGLLAPDYVVRSLRKKYQSAVANGLPDSLDMLVMCAESGLSLEPASTWNRRAYAAPLALEAAPLALKQRRSPASGRQRE